MVRPWFPPHGPHDSGNPMELTPRIGAFGSFTAHIAGGITLQWRKVVLQHDQKTIVAPQSGYLEKVHLAWF